MGKNFLVLGIIVLVLLAAGLYGLREILIGPRLLAAVNQRLAPALGVELEAERIGGNYFRTLEISGLRGVGGATTRLSRLELEATSLRLEYSLPALSRGLEAFLATVRIRLNDGRFLVELAAIPHTEDSGASAFPTAILAALDQNSAPLWHQALTQAGQVTRLIPAIQVANLELRIQGPDLTLAATAIELDYLPPPPGAATEARLNLQSAGITLDHPLLHPPPAPLALELGLASKPESNILDLTYLHWGELLRVNAASLATGATTLRLELPLQALGSDFQLQAELREDYRELAATLDSLELADLQWLLPTPPPLTGALSGHLWLHTDPTQPLPGPQAELTGLPADLTGGLELRLRQASFAGRELDDLDLHTTIGQGHLYLPRLAARLGSNRLLVEDLRLPLAAIPVGPRQPTSQEAWAGQPSWPLLLDQAHLGRLSADLTDIPALAAALGFTVPPEYDPALPRHRLLLEAGLEQGRLNLREVSLQTAAGRLELPTAEIGPWPASANLYDLPIKADLHLDIADLTTMARLFQPAAPLQPAGRLRADLELQGTPAAPVGRLELTGQGLVWNEWRLASIQAAFNGQGQVSPAAIPVLAASRLELTATGLSLAELDLGKLQLQAELAASPDLPTVKLRLQAAELATVDWRLTELAARMQSSGSAADPRLTGSLGLQGVRFNNPEQKLGLPELSGIIADFTWQSGHLTLPRLELNREPDRLTAAFSLALPAAPLPAPATGPATFGQTAPLSPMTTSPGDPGDHNHPWLPFLQIYRELSSLSPATVAIPKLEAKLTVADLAAYAALFGAIGEPTGTLALEISGGGKPALHEFHANLELASVRWAEASLASLSSRLTFQVSHQSEKTGFSFALPDGTLAALAGEGEFLLTDLVYSGTVINQGRGRAWLELEALTLSGVEINSGDGRLRLAGKVFGLQTPPPTIYRLELEQLELKHEQLHLNLARTAHLRLGDGRLQVSDFEIGGHGATISLIGDYNPNDPAAELDLQGHLHSDDLSWLAAFIPGVRRLEGQLAADFHLHGPARDPQMAGGLSFTGGELRLEGDAPALRELRLTATFDRDGLAISELGGLWGGAPFQVGGRIDLPSGFPLELRPASLAAETIFNLSLRGEDILFYRAEGILVRGQGALQISGPLARLRIDGQVAIHDGRYTRNLDFFQAFRAPGGGPRRQTGLGLFSLTSPPWRDLSFDIRLTATRPFLVVNNMARGSLRPELHLGGSGELPVLTGEIYLDPTRITLPAARLEIGSGLIRFPARNPDQPEFDLLASTRMAGYDISLVLQGTAAEPVLTLSSTPPLPDDQLLVLLLTGQLPAALGEEAARRRAGMNVAVFLGRDLLARLFHGDEPPSDEALLERFQLEVGRAITRAGDETIEAELWLIDDFFRPGARLYLTGEKDVYDDFNLGLKIVFRFR